MRGWGSLINYVKRGWIKPIILESGKWRFREEDVDRLMGVAKPKITILYARVSSQDQKEDLDRQVKALEGWAPHSKMWRFPHSVEFYEGAVGWGHPERAEAEDMGPDERGPEACEAKG